MRQKMVIVSSYFSGERYGLLGPQLAATIIRRHSDCDCIVAAVTNEDDKDALQAALKDYFEGQRPVVGFSLLSGREDLFAFARKMTGLGALTILGGPQAEADFRGEVDWRRFPHRFHGLSDHFSLAVTGPAEQAIPVLGRVGRAEERRQGPGILRKRENGRVAGTAANEWDPKYLAGVEWDNLYVLSKGGLVRHPVRTAQVLQQIGCPHAAAAKTVEIDYPAALSRGDDDRIVVSAKGCSFCDVAADKGFCGTLDDDTVLGQVACLPEDRDGRKIPFELINENPLPGLPRLLERLSREKLPVSQINLIMRADWFLAGEKRLEEALRIATKSKARILMSSLGLEAFDDRLLKNFNKGTTVRTNIEAVRLMRRLKEVFPQTWLYSNREGAIHGFIHPTPWDTRESFESTQRTIAVYGLANDILPRHSTPLIIHHASALGDWIRAVESRERVRYPRHGSIVGWWDHPGKESGSATNVSYLST